MELISNNNHKKWIKKWDITNAVFRNHDLPSIVYFDGERCWHKKGKIHREKDLPSIISYNGCKCWYKDGKNVQEKEYPSER
jgi:hypothetical protein